MIEYKSTATFNIKSRGKVIVVPNDKDRERDDLANIVGTNVLIDGTEYTVLGVESYAIPRVIKDMPIGIFIGEEPHQTDIPEEFLN